MRISIVVATYRRPEPLRRCVEGLLAQTRTPDEIVLVVKDSDPASRQMAEALAALPDAKGLIRIARVRERGILHAEYAGVAAATGDVVAFVDDDAVARASWLARLADWYEDETVGAAGGQDVIHDAGRVDRSTAVEVGRLTWYGRSIGNHHKFVAGGARDVDFLKGCNMSLRRGLMPPIDRRLCGEYGYRWEDNLCLAVRRRGYRVVYDPAVLVDHHVERGAAFIEGHDLTPAHLEGAHNYVYNVLRHFPWWRKVVFLAYSFLIGDGSYPGLAHALVQAARSGRWRETFARYANVQKGKIAGVGTYLGRGGRGWPWGAPHYE